MMITKYHIMTECKESGIGKNGFKLALGALLATVGMGLSGCNKSSAAENQAPTAKVMKLASADEAKDFATLSLNVQQQIRTEFDECMADVEQFSKDGSGGSKEVEEILFDDGADDCDSIRNSNIGIAIAEKGIAETTRSITSGS